MFIDLNHAAILCTFLKIKKSCPSAKVISLNKVKNCSKFRVITIAMKKRFIIFAACTLLALFADDARAQDANGEKRQAVTGQAKDAGQSRTAQSDLHSSQEQHGGAPKDDHKAPSDKKWGIKITTGDKWYQLSVKLLM
jgi:hypothetical protein